MENGSWMKPSEASERYGTNRMFIWRHRKIGNIRTKDNGGNSLVYIPDLIAQLEQNSWMDQSPEERFWRFVTKDEGCWEWRGSKNRGGYGFFVFDSVKYLAHRFSYELANGERLGGLLCCHKCDNPPCVNPDHLFSGTHIDNIQDAMKKGRLVRTEETKNKIRGTKNGRSILTPRLVRKIRMKSNENGHTIREIADEIGVSYAVVYFVLSGITWTHVK